jgi:ZIP family zinc transporter
MTPTYIAVILLSLLSSVTTILGIALAISLRGSTQAVVAGLGFSAGIMILISLLELLPESSTTLGIVTALASGTIGSVLVWAVHFIIRHTHLIEETGKVNKTLVKSAYLVIFGLILHDVPEGFAMANAYIADPALGLLVAVAIALHNLPEEFAMAVPAITFKSKRFLFGAALLSALAEPVGAIIGLAAVGVAPALNAHFLAFAAGAMIFIAVHELIPMARRYQQAGVFFGGMIISLIVYGLLA